MMRRVLCLVVCAVASIACRADLSSDVNAVLGEKLLAKVKTGIEVVKLGETAETSVVLYAHNASDPYVPASNLKVVTTSAALDALGVDFKFRTLLVQHGEDLVLIGDGDPTLGDAEFLRKAGWDATTVFRNWAEAMVKKGLTHVRDVIVDDSVFEEAGYHPHWPIADSLQRFSAEVGGLNLNANCVEFSFTFNGDGEPASYRTTPDTAYLTVQNRVIGGNGRVVAQRDIASNVVTFSRLCPPAGETFSLTVHDPSVYTGTVLAETLRASGIEVSGDVHRDRTVRSTLAHRASAPTPAAPPATTQATQPTTTPAAAAPQWTLLAVHETPLLQVMARANKDSMNLYAEALGKRTGFAVSGGQSGSWENGTAAVAAFLQKAGVAPAEFHLDDGCGLSHQNTVSPNAMVRVLAYDFFGKNRQAYVNTLSVAGSDGTLERRFPAPYTDLRGRVFGKSGFVEGVSSLCGYLHARDDQWYAFSILMNGIPAKSNSAYKPLQEAIVRAIDEQAGKAAK